MRNACIGLGMKDYPWPGAVTLVRSRVAGFGSPVPPRRHRQRAPRPPTATPSSTSTSSKTLERAPSPSDSEQRHVIVEPFLHNRTNDDIGQDLGISGSAVSLLATTALKRLHSDVALRDWVGLAA